jgi:hypothetical protein
MGLLGLDYSVWPATVTILLIDWPAVADRLTRRRAGVRPGTAGIGVAGTGTAPP